MLKLLACIVLCCAGPIEVKPGQSVQRACDKAVENSQAVQEVWLLAGDHPVSKPVIALCPIKGIGRARLKYTGEAADKPCKAHEKQGLDLLCPECIPTLLTVRGTPNWPTQPSVRDLEIHCDGKLSALHVDDVHRAIIARIKVYRARGYGIRATKVWCLTIQDPHVNYSVGRAYDFCSFSGSCAHRLATEHVRGDGPIVRISGQADIRELAVEDCDSGNHQAIELHNFRNGSLSGLWTERLKCREIVRLKGSRGATLERFFHWQQATSPAKVAVMVAESRDCTVRQVIAYNCRDAIVRIDAQSVEDGCVADRRTVEDGYIDLPAASKKYVVQPRHIIDYQGWDHDRTAN